MNTLQGMLFKMIIKAFALILLLLIFILILVEFFQNLITYLNYDTPLLTILKIHLYYIPSCIYQAFPLVLLSAISFSLGNLYSNNELISVFASGFPLTKLVTPVLIFSILASIFSFLFQEFVVLDASAQMKTTKGEATRQYTRQQDIQAAIDHNNGIIYYADYFVPKASKLRRIVIVERNERNQLLARIDAASADWDEDKGQWILYEARVFTWSEDGKMLEESYFSDFTSDKLTLDPRIFRSVDVDVEEMKFLPAWHYLDALKTTGRRDEYLSGITPLYRRITFPFVCLIVSMFACSIGSWFKKNILILSLGISLGLAVVYYVFQMITVLMAKNGYLPPFLGAVLPEIIFTLVGINLFKNARS